MQRSGNTILRTGGTSGICMVPARRLPAEHPDLTGQGARSQGMPLPALSTEVMEPIRTDQDAVEICGHDVQFLRETGAQGRHDDVLATKSAAH